MKHLSSIGLLVAILFTSLQAQDYVLAWDHVGVPATSFTVSVDGAEPVNVGRPVRADGRFAWNIPQTASKVIVSACNALGRCAPSQPVEIPPLPAPPTNLQIGILGNTLPQGDSLSTPPTSLGAFT